VITPLSYIKFKVRSDALAGSTLHFDDSFTSLIDGTENASILAGSTLVNVLVPNPTPIPVNDLVLYIGDHAATLTFSKPTGATSVVLEQSINGTDYVPASTIVALDENSAHEGISNGVSNNGQSYTFRLVIIGGTHTGSSNLVAASPVYSWKCIN
jgi:hypothetical protein